MESEDLLKNNITRVLQFDANKIESEIICLLFILIILKKKILLLRL